MTVLTIKINKIEWVRITIKINMIPIRQDKIINTYNGALLIIPLSLHLMPTLINLILDIILITINILLKNLSLSMSIIVKLLLWKLDLKNLNLTKSKFSKSWSVSIKYSKTQILNLEWLKLIDIKLKVLKALKNLHRKVDQMPNHPHLAGLIVLAKSHVIRSFKLQLCRENKWKWCWTIVWKKYSNYWLHR